MKLSIIIPVYNVERYVAKCLYSCLKQDIPPTDYEIVIVNDGTSDNSMAIVERIATQHSNIRIINQENQGLSMARNNGFDQANGEYVWFVDSDDWIEENCLGRIISFFRNNVDVLQLQYRYVYENGFLSKDADFCNIEGIKNGKDVIIKGGLPAPAPFSIYRSQFLKDNNLKFVSGIYHEDSEFKPRATYLSSKIASDNVVSYNYLQRNAGSITSLYKLKNGIDILFVMNSLLKFTKEYELTQQERQAFYRFIGLDMNSLLFGYRQLNATDKAIVRKELKDNRHLFACMINSKSIKYQMEGICFTISMHFGFFMHRLLR